MNRSRIHSSVSFLTLLALLLFPFLPQTLPVRAQAATELLFSEYIEGSSNNKALEIYNGTYATIDLAAANYDVQMYFNGSSSPGLTIALTGSIASGDVFVLAHSEADQAILAQADQTNNSSWYNGNDAVVLRKNGSVIDSIGQIGTDPGTEWGAGLVSTADNTLRRWDVICFGDYNPSDDFNATINLHWQGYDTDTFDGLGSHTSVCTPVILINELDAGQASTDSAEFIELYDGGAGNVPLDGLVLVLFNGSGDVSYRAFDLDGYSTGANGYFVLCANAVNTPNCDLDVSPDTDLLQNGADAAALYKRDASIFPNGTPVTTANLLDALVYDTGDNDDAGLLVLLNPGQPQVDEDGRGYQDVHSIQRCPDGNGGARNTSAFQPYPPTPGGTNTWCGPAEWRSCGDAAQPIHAVQGSDNISPLVSVNLVIEGTVVGDFQDTSSGLGGFFVQEEDDQVDADPLTSEGIFIYDDGFGVDVSVGERVRVMGDVTEYQGLTELGGIDAVTVCPDPGTASAATVTLPAASLVDWERREGMLVQFPQTLFVTENFNLGQYGEVELSVDGRLFAPTQVAAPGAPALAQQDLNDRSRIQLDDGSRLQTPLPLPPYLGLENTLRGGDSTQGLVGVLSYSYGSFEIQPTEPVVFNRVNDRPDPPAGIVNTLRIAGMNVLNYFTTIDTGDWICGPSGKLECRGADSSDEFNRQRDKLIQSILGLDAAIIGLTEIENNPNEAIQDLVDGLNDLAGAGTYDFIDTGTIGTDAIKVALIYQPHLVKPVGSFAILDSTVDPNFLDTKNRPSLAQTFETPKGDRFTVAVNHLKSKGSDCNDVGDPDANDGQGNCNGTRTNAAKALVKWLSGDPTASADPDFLILGDLNSYAQEDPVRAILDGGYASLTGRFLSWQDAYSYVFQGQAGELDHALASIVLSFNVESVTVWHINADEPRALDYNDDNQPGLYQPDEFRSADHDPLLVLLNFEKQYWLMLPYVESH